MDKSYRSDLVACGSCSKQAQVIEQHGIWCSQCGMEPFPEESWKSKAWRNYSRFVSIHISLLVVSFGALWFGIGISILAPAKAALWRYGLIALWLLWAYYVLVECTYQRRLLFLHARVKNDE